MNGKTAPANKIHQLRPYVDYILETLGMTDATITDASKIDHLLDAELWDKDDHGERTDLNEDGERYIAHISSIIGVKIKLGDHIHDIASRFAKQMS